jgi:hypothetical protein
MKIIMKMEILLIERKRLRRLGESVREKKVEY